MDRCRVAAGVTKGPFQRRGSAGSHCIVVDMYQNHVCTFSLYVYMMHGFVHTFYMYRYMYVCLVLGPSTWAPKRRQIAHLDRQGALVKLQGRGPTKTQAKLDDP